MAAFGCSDGCCPEGDSNAGPLPPDPQDWVCPDSVVELSRAEIDAWCADNAAPHYQLIERQDQVPIYEERVVDSDGDLTSSFLRRVRTLKNNRIRPKGFDPAVFAASPSPYVRELAPIPGEAQFDPDYTDPARTGADRIEYHVALAPEQLARVGGVSATLYNQSIPPFFLQQRFADATIGAREQDNIRRLS